MVARSNVGPMAEEYITRGEFTNLTESLNDTVGQLRGMFDEMNRKFNVVGMTIGQTQSVFGARLSDMEAKAHQQGMLMEELRKESVTTRTSLSGLDVASGDMARELQTVMGNTSSEISRAFFQMDSWQTNFVTLNGQVAELQRPMALADQACLV